MPTFFSIDRSQDDKNGERPSEQDFSAKGDAFYLPDSVISGGSLSTLSTVGGIIPASAVGKTIAIPYAGASKTMLQSWPDVGKAHAGGGDLILLDTGQIPPIRLAQSGLIFINGTGYTGGVGYTLASFGIGFAHLGGYAATASPTQFEWYTTLPGPAADTSPTTHVTTITAVAVGGLSCTLAAAASHAVSWDLSLHDHIMTWIGTDDTVALRRLAAIGSARAYLTLPGGNYLITGAITLQKGQRWSGLGRDSSIIVLAHDDQDGIRIQTTESCTIEGIGFDTVGIATGGSQISVDGTAGSGKCSVAGGGVITWTSGNRDFTVYNVSNPFTVAGLDYTITAATSNVSVTVTPAPPTGTGIAWSGPCGNISDANIKSAIRDCGFNNAWDAIRLVNAEFIDIYNPRGVNKQCNDVRSQCLLWGDFDAGHIRGASFGNSRTTVPAGTSDGLGGVIPPTGGSLLVPAASDMRTTCAHRIEGGVLSFRDCHPSIGNWVAAANSGGLGAHFDGHAYATAYLLRAGLTGLPNAAHSNGNAFATANSFVSGIISDKSRISSLFFDAEPAQSGYSQSSIAILNIHDCQLGNGIFNEVANLWIQSPNFVIVLITNNQFYCGTSTIGANLVAGASMFLDGNKFSGAGGTSTGIRIVASASSGNFCLGVNSFAQITTRYLTPTLTFPISYTDLRIDATTNTNMTSAAHPFSLGSVGEAITITSGSGFTVQTVVVVSVVGVIATCSAALGTVSSTGGVGSGAFLYQLDQVDIGSPLMLSGGILDLYEPRGAAAGSAGLIRFNAPLSGNPSPVAWLGLATVLTGSALDFCIRNELGNIALGYNGSVNANFHFGGAVDFPRGIVTILAGGAAGTIPMLLPTIAAGWGTAPAGLRWNLAVDSVGNVTSIVAPSSVASIAGTANQITATGTGAITLSLPSSLILPGALAVPAIADGWGTAAAGAYWNVVVDAVGNFTSVIPAAGTANQITAVTTNGTIVLSLPANVILPGTLNSGVIALAIPTIAATWGTRSAGTYWNLIVDSVGNVTSEVQPGGGATFTAQTGPNLRTTSSGIANTAVAAASNSNADLYSALNTNANLLNTLINRFVNAETTYNACITALRASALFSGSAGPDAV